MSSKVLVIARRFGRLANGLVLFANVIAFARAHGHRVINVAFQPHADLFETTAGDVYCRFPPVGARSWLSAFPGLARGLLRTQALLPVVRAASVVNGRLPLFGSAITTLYEDRARHSTLLDSPDVQRRIRRAAVVLAYGWNFRAPVAVREHARDIRAFFRPLQRYEAVASDVVNRLRRGADVVVGVHVRQGDYRWWRGGRYCYTAHQYAGWMREVAAQLPGRRAAFLVCSDEPRRPDEFGGLRLALGPGTPVTDLYALAKCDLIIGAPSTFSQWASFAGDVPLLHVYDSREPIALDRFAVSYLDVIPASLQPPD